MNVVINVITLTITFDRIPLKITCYKKLCNMYIS